MKNVRIIIFYSDLPDLRYFYDRLVDCAKQKGIDYLIADVLDPDSYAADRLLDFIKDEPAVMFTFNQSGIGLINEGENFWKKYGIPVYDFTEDHPRNFADALLHPMCDISVFSLDLDHIAFIDRFYPEIKRKYFLPNGGTKVSGFKSFKERSMNVLYMGGCQREETIFPTIEGLPNGGLSFYHDTIDMMKYQPDLTTEKAIDRYFSDHSYAISEDDILKLNLIPAGFIERQVRRYFKLMGMHALDDAGIDVDIYGSNWEDEDRPFSDRIRMHSRISSSELNCMICDARMSLCFTPWYKRGCSEKQFNAMLNGALCISDRNSYLDINYRDGENIVFFDLNNPEQMAADAVWLLDHPDAAEQIAYRGYETAIKYDTWEKRFDSIIEYIKLRHDI